MKLNKNIPNIQNDIWDDIKSDGRPLVIYGAGEVGTRIADILKKHNIQVYCFAVDEKFYQEGVIICDIPVKSYENILREYDKYLFVLGIGQPNWRVKEFLQDTRGKRIAIFSYYGEFAFIDAAFVNDNIEKLNETYEWLADDLSKETMEAFLNLKLTGDVRYNFNVACDGMYFNDLTAPCRGGVFVDCGAYDGETIKDYFKWSGGKYNQIIAFEPEMGNFEKLEKTVDNLGNSIRIFPIGIWDKKETLKFNSGVGSASSVGNNGKFIITVDSLDNMIDEEIDYIKMDIEGAELKALYGASKLIRRYHPFLAISVYHKTEDLITIPQYIKSFETAKFSYRLFLRKHHVGNELELVLYAVPEDL